MDASARDTYLETQVLTATPQKLQLMLIDGAIRFAGQTREFRKQGRVEDAMESLIRCRRIVCEILCGVKRDGSEPAKRVTSLYYYLFKTLTEAQLRHDDAKLAEVVRVLEVERETWQKVCEKLGAAPNAAPTPLAAAPRLKIDDAPPIESLSLEA